MPLKDWKPVDYVMLVFAVTIAYSTVMTITYVYFGHEIGDEGSKRLTNIIITMLSILAIWVGGIMANKRNNKKDED